MPAQSFNVSPGEVADHYDDLDSLYRQFWGEHVHHGLWSSPDAIPEEATRHLIDAVVEQAHIGRGSAVCDAGCGYGGTSRVLAHELGANVTALTISPAQYAYAQSVDPKSGNPVYLLRDWLENGLDGDSFDAVVAIESSEHMPDLVHRFQSSNHIRRLDRVCKTTCGRRGPY
jgi:tocopherol O-methyltransferase